MGTISVAPWLRVAALLGLYTLDLLDLYAKVAWFGPTESFSFKETYERSFEENPLPKPAFLTAVNLSVETGTELLRTSGWTSYYDKCRELYATKHDESFHMITAANCDLGAPFAHEKDVAHEVVLSAGVRADSVAWVSCQLLFFHRRPPICQENLVTLFSQRYSLTEDELDPEQMAPINSQAEAELWRMLDLLSRSHPLSNVVCSQGFQSTSGPGYYTASIFICGSPNVFESATIGSYATSFPGLHYDLAWLMVDKVNIMGFELVLRQNARSQFSLREKDGELVVTEARANNFSLFGHLYVILVISDVILLIANTRAALETCRFFGSSLLLGFKMPNDEINCSCSGTNWSSLYRSLYRSDTIVALTILSSLLSWLVGVLYASIWTNNYGGQVLAVLSLLRVWMLVLCLLNLLWGVFVSIAEACAYYTVKRTFVTILEVIVATTIVICLETGRVFKMFAIKRLRDGQQVVDDDAFLGSFAVANAYCEDLNGFATTQLYLMVVLFSPLAIVISESLALVVLIIVGRLIYYRSRRLQQENNTGTSITALRNLDNTDSTDQRSSAAPLLARDITKVYHRLPLEELIHMPARANSLVRSSFDMEDVTDDGQIYIFPSVYYDFGVVVSEAGLLLTRRGFFNVIHRRLDVERFFAPREPTSSVCPSPLKRQKVGDRQVLSKPAFVLDNVPSLADSIFTEKGSPSPPRMRPEFKPTPMSRSMRRRKSMEDLLDSSFSKL